MIGMGGGGGTGDTQFTFKRVIGALLIISLLPITINLFVAPVNVDEWQTEYESIAQTYYEATGTPAGAGMELWTLSYIAEPYTSTYYGYTDDGWLHGGMVTDVEPSQYQGAAWAGETFKAARADNGVWYYTVAPSNNPNIVVATTDDGDHVHITDYNGATVYSAVVMDNAHTSDTFFTASDRTESDGHFYYGYTGWRYAFSPLHSYTATNGDGTVYDVKSSNSSLSLIWYQYNGLDGIAGQLSLSGADNGLSFLSAADIVRAYEGINFTATFDMKFNSIPMHIQIRLNPTAIATGMSVEDCWNGGYWSVMVYGDRDVEDYVGGLSSSTDNYSIENMFSIFIDLFSFRISDHYDIDGWVGILASLTFSLAFYAVLIAIAVSNPYMWFIIALIGAIQTFISVGTGWWPF